MNDAVAPRPSDQLAAPRSEVGHAIALFGVLAAALASVMIAIALGGTSQEYFESIHAPAEYARELLEHAGPLRTVFALDGLFLLAYSAFFVAYVSARRGHTSQLVLRLVLGSVLVAAGLDAIENFHILGMLHVAEAGGLPSAAQIEAQYVLSAVKFTIGYFAAIGLALSYPRDSGLARMVALSTGLAFPVVGVLAYVVPAPWSHVLGLARVVFFVSGYALSALVFWPTPRPRLVPMTGQATLRIP